MLAEIGVFAAKFFIVLFFVFILFVLIGALIQKAQAMKHKIDLDNLGHNYDFYQDLILAHVGSDEELKEHKKTLKKLAKEQEKTTKPKVFVVDFKGSVDAHEGENLREEISAVLTTATPKDEVLVRVESPGGTVHGYGFCASQLDRIKQAKIPLVVCVDKVAASGGYMMACLADRLIAAPFAIIGSIGVLAQVPNLNRLLKRFDVDYKEYTAGDYKKTVSIFGPISPEGEKKFVDQMEQTHILFKDHVANYRPKIDMDKVATGEYWFGHQALKLDLVDELGTSDSYLFNKAKTHHLVKIEHKSKKKFTDKISESLSLALFRGVSNALKNWQNHF